MRPILSIFVAMATVLSVFPAGCLGDEGGGSEGADSLKVTLGFASFPEKYTCEGENLSPPVEIDGLDESVASVAMILEDPDAPLGTFVHWLIWNLEPSATMPEGIPPEGEVSDPAGAVQGTNGFGLIGYYGPCPPPGQVHRYVLKVRGLDAILDLAPGSGRADLEAAMEGRVLTSGEAVATYGR
ncbi:MAG TPA: YbhB/YbcL family Raf kinase inhibitor-like protein [Methanothrix sp.]|nr:YbhB/YbcL family Raf kinase inhibitor-like protein [Methanothrix sp.]HPJ85157.1 YbhB/YbcL family Raf kinase inhibitor-like protein [Methanothrix sp.]HPR67176.1 YbhB/YbcL family Raf kinase inhibitor-like protein [Methanothrix sp.]